MSSDSKLGFVGFVVCLSVVSVGLGFLVGRCYAGGPPEPPEPPPVPIPEAGTDGPFPAPPAPQPAEGGQERLVSEWDPVDDPSTVEGRWEEGNGRWAEILSQATHRKGGLYPWYLKLWPLSAGEVRPGFDQYIECGFYEKLTQLPEANVDGQPWRVSYCWGGDLANKKGAAARRLVILRRGKKVTVQSGNEYSVTGQRVTRDK